MSVIVPASIIRHWYAAFAALLAVPAMFRVSRSKLVALMAVAFVAVCVQFYMLHTEAAPRLLHTDESGEVFSIFEEGDFRTEVYKSAIGDYENMSVMQKVLRLPVSMAIQFLSPLPWGFTRHLAFGLSYFHNHLSIPWYCILGLILYFVLFCIGKAPVSVAKALIMGR